MVGSFGGEFSFDVLDSQEIKVVSRQSRSQPLCDVKTTASVKNGSRGHATHAYVIAIKQNSRQH